MSLEEILALDDGCPGCPVCQPRLPRRRRPQPGAPEPSRAGPAEVTTHITVKEEPVSTSETATTANRYLRPEHLSATRWLALPELSVGGSGIWQDVSLRPELRREAGPLADPSADPEIARPRPEGFTVEICTSEVLEEDFEHAAGPHPRELLPPGAEVALDVGRMAVYLARPFSSAEALAYSEALLVEAGVPVASLEEADRDAFYGNYGAEEGA